MNIRKNDTILVIAGEERGKKGKIRLALPKDDRVIVEGINMIKRHTKARGGVRQAGIIEREAPLHISNVMLVCDKCGKPSRIKIKFLEDGKKVRMCRRCNEVLD